MNVDPDKLLTLLVQQNAQLQRRLDLILAALLQTSGSPFLAPLPRAMGSQRYTTIQHKNVALPTTTGIILKPNPQRRRALFMNDGQGVGVIGPSRPMPNGSLIGINLGNMGGQYLLANEESFGDLVRDVWYGTSTMGTQTINIVEEILQ